MNLDSPTITIDKSAEEAFNFLSDVKNFEKLMPETINKFEVLGEDKFLFALKGMPEIVLKKKDETPHSQVVLGAAGGALDFALVANIEEIDDTQSEVSLNFNGKFNTMMSMMIKSPIKKFLQTLASNMPEAI
ncbi:MAG: SRPBCC family protein [Winogradskyella sp.]|uniref:SRPBCC family protein n=1 Tax=Winogradskyella sp. TaxID=1883156 RepID=UPI000F3EE587|nr:SRPBCC family protein [Winogradskyella sp.]RNC83543.1 MAG: SRPBCC family protein [Winogradskyella sp.]